MQLEVDLKHMQANFGGRDLSGFGGFAHFLFAFKMAKKFPFGPWTIGHGGQTIESTQKIHASRG